MQLDRNLQRLVAHYHLGFERYWRWVGELQRRREHADDISYRHAHDWRTNLHRHSGGSILLVHDFADQSVPARKRRHGFSDRDHNQQLQLDRVEPRDVGDDQQRRERNRLWNGRLHGGCEYGYDFEERDADDRRQVVHGERIGHDVLRLGLAHGHHRATSRRYRHDHGDDHRGLQLDEFIERHVGDRDRIGHRFG
jgi:hypothetical protein